jgi:hypothetical protein
MVCTPKIRGGPQKPRDMPAIAMYALSSTGRPLSPAKEIVNLKPIRAPNVRRTPNIIATDFFIIDHTQLWMDNYIFLHKAVI